MTSAGLLDVAKRVAESGEPHHQRDVAAAGELVAGRIVDLSILPLDDMCVAMTFVDVTEARAAEARLKALADSDQLTGLWNRSRFRAELSGRVIRGLPTVVALLDINDFKLINDTMGHSVGDLLLQVLGDRFGARLPGDWLVARLGGDEFAVAAPGEAHEAAAVAQRLVETVRQPLHLDGIRVRPEATIGISCFPGDGDDVGGLMRLADAALAVARAAGEPYHVSGPHDRREAENREHLNKRLTSSFARDEFMLYAQPIVDLKKYEIVGAEGLARWVLPGTGVLNPGTFIDLLAMAGRTTELTDYMIGRAVGLTGAGRFMSINLSPADLHRSDLVASVQQALARQTADTRGDLWLEILESRVFAAGHQLIDELIDTNVRVAIDDFGAAFSSLSRLADHEVSVLKLDRQLLQSLGTNARARRVVQSVVDTSHDLGAVVVAEGVETMEACSVVEDLGCDLVQGFLLGRPAPEHMVSELLMRPGRLTPSDWPDVDQIRQWENDALARRSIGPGIR